MLPADVDAVAQLEDRCFTEPWTPGAFEQFVGASGFLLAIAPSNSTGAETTPPFDGTLAGYIVTSPASRAPMRVAHVRNLAVDPRFRRRGLGRRLLRASLDPYRQSGLDWARLEVRESNTPAIELYADAGFESIERRPEYYRDGETAVVMAMPLTDTE